MYKILLIILILILYSFSAFCGTTGKLVGIVSDKLTREPLIGVNIEITEIGMGAATGNDGYYLINNIPPGLYTVSASYIGYKKVEIQEVTITVDKTTEIPIELEATTLELEETITVIADRPLIL